MEVQQIKMSSWSSTDPPSDKRRPMDGAQFHALRVGEDGGELRSKSKECKRIGHIPVPNMGFWTPVRCCAARGYTSTMIPIGSHPAWHPVFETLAYASGYAVFRRLRAQQGTRWLSRSVGRCWPRRPWERWWAAACWASPSSGPRCWLPGSRGACWLCCFRRAARRLWADCWADGSVLKL